MKFNNRTDNIKHRWRWTVPLWILTVCFMHQFRVLTFTRWFLAQNLNFQRTKALLGVTIHTERHQFYWDQGIMYVMYLIIFNLYHFWKTLFSRYLPIGLPCIVQIWGNFFYHLSSYNFTKIVGNLQYMLYFYCIILTLSP